MKCIIAHGDLDGLTAAAILVDALEKESGGRAVLLIAQPFTLSSVLAKALALRDLDRLYIVDVGVDPGTWSQVKERLSRVKLRTEIVVWIDHHRTTLERLEELARLGISLVYSIDGSAASIARYAFLDRTSDPEFFEKLAIIGEISDRVREADPSDPLARAAEILGSSLSARARDEDFKIGLVRKWVEEKVLIDEEVERAAEEARSRLGELLREAERRKMYESEKLVVVDFREVPARGYISRVAAEYASRTGKITILLFYSGPKEVVATCRVPEELEVDAARVLAKIAGEMGGSSGGHPKACSIRVPRERVEALVRKLTELEARVVGS